MNPELILAAASSDAVQITGIICSAIVILAIIWLFHKALSDI